MHNSEATGIGPALACLILATGATGFQSWIPYAIFVIGACLAGVCAWRLRVAGDKAAKGQAWQRHLVETAGEGIWVIDPEGVIGYANPRMAEILGCGVEQIQGRGFEAFVFPEDVPAERIRFQSRRAGIKQQYDRRLRRADGSEAWMLACSSPYSYRNEFTGVLTMMTDITERKIAEQALRSSERKFRELFENIREGVYQTSPDGRILAANPELLRMLGFSNRDELNVAGMVRDTFVDRNLHQSLRDRLERDSSYANVEFQLRTRDHRIITVRENARVVRDENGGVLYYEGSLTDITDKVRSVNRHGREPRDETAAGSQTGGIAPARLRRALDILPPDSPARPLLDAVAGSLNCTAAIDLNALIADMEPTLRGLGMPGSSLGLALCESPTPVLANAGQLERIVSGFVIHAREFHPEIMKIDIATVIEASGPEGGAGPVVCLSVLGHGANNGCACGEEARPWMDTATTQAMVALYGGVMTAVAEPQGIRCCLRLPLASRAFSGTGAATILLVEEEPLIRELSRDLLERQGFQVLVATDAAEAERMAIGGETFDVLMTETDGESGNALVQKLRDMRPGLRVLFVTGSDGFPESLPAPTGSAVVRKPFSGDSLGRQVRLLLDRP